MKRNQTGIAPIGKNGRFVPECRLRDMVESHSRLLHTINRFGIPLGFGDRTVAEICAENNVDCGTFLAVSNYLSGFPRGDEKVSIEALMQYLIAAHDHILNFSLPSIRKKLIESINYSDTRDVAFLIIQYFDDYVEEVKSHMEYENNTIFPYCRHLLEKRRDQHFHIGMYTDHHGNVTRKLNELKDIIINHYSQRDNKLLVSALYDVMSCEDDLSTHCGVEENLFMPEVKLLEEELSETYEEPEDTDASNEEESDSLAPISDREREIIRYVALGYTNKEIADKLFLSFYTVTTHRRNIAAKLQIHSTAGLAIYAILNKIIDLNEINLHREAEGE